MKQIVVISGKGGTGKTVITGAFASLAENKVMADCDVDAADLHLLLSPEIKERHLFRSGVTAFIHSDKCVRCGKCLEVCRFDAVGKDYAIDPVSCEGCAFCGFVCPENAIEMKENLSGEWFVSRTRFGPMIHARLGIAEENSGKLVSLVREKAKETALEQKRDFVIIDGSPGIGCPVIASLTGVDYAVVVTEPTLSGLHDASRVVNVARHFNVPVRLVINKYDLNPEMTVEIEKYCRDSGVPVLGRVEFDRAVVESVVRGKTIIEYTDKGVSRSVRAVWERLERDVRNSGK